MKTARRPCGASASSSVSYSAQSYSPRDFSVAAQEKSIRTKVNPAAASWLISPPCGSVKWMFTPRPKGNVVAPRGSDIDSGRTEGGFGLDEGVVDIDVVVVVVL